MSSIALAPSSLFSARVYLAAIVLATLCSGFLAEPFYSGTASLQQLLLGAVPFLVVLLSLVYLSSMDWIAYLVFRKEFGPLVERPEWTDWYRGLEHYIYSSLIAFEHVYVSAAFLVVILWYENPGLEHLEPLAVYFGLLAGLMEWVRTRIRPLLVESKRPDSVES